MEETDYLDIIEGMLYLVGDDGVDLKQIAGVLEISKKEAANLMKEFENLYEQRQIKGITLVNIIKRWLNKVVRVFLMLH